MDLEKLESLSRFVSSPSVVAGSTTTTIGKDGDESVTATVRLAQHSLDGRSILTSYDADRVD